jgi:hypothetical protein
VADQDDDRREDEAQRHNPWVRYPIDVGDRVRLVGPEQVASPLRLADEGTILLFEFDPVHPHVHVNWDRTGTGIVPLSAIRNVEDGPE